MGSAELDDRGLIVACPACGQKNRIAYERLADPVRCAKCKQDITPPGEPIEIASMEDFDRLLADCCICQPATFWRRRITNRVGLFDDSLHFAMDFEYWLRIDRAGGMLAQAPEYLACTRIYPQTKTQSARLEVEFEDSKSERPAKLTVFLH